jgi:hypothetical protein
LACCRRAAKLARLKSRLDSCVSQFRNQPQQDGKCVSPEWLVGAYPNGTHVRGMLPHQAGGSAISLRPALVRALLLLRAESRAKAALCWLSATPTSPGEPAQGCRSPLTKRFAPFCAGEDLAPSLTLDLIRADAPRRRTGQRGLDQRTVWQWAGFGSPGHH